MKVQIWSDVMCPYCYIGKKNFETALAKFQHRDEVEIEWKSFELDPVAPKNPIASMARMLAAKYNKSAPEVHAMMEQLSATAKRAGLEFNLKKAIPTNSFDAHRLIHLAAKYGKQAVLIEKLFSAYLIEGQDLARAEVLTKIATEVGLPLTDIQRVLNTTEFAEEVRRDENEAFHLKMKGVPFFWIERKFSVSGAQPVEHFLQALQQVWDKRSSK